MSKSLKEIAQLLKDANKKELEWKIIDTSIDF